MDTKVHLYACLHWNLSVEIHRREGGAKKLLNDWADSLKTRADTAQTMAYSHSCESCEEVV